MHCVEENDVKSCTGHQTLWAKLLKFTHIYNNNNNNKDDYDDDDGDDDNDNSYNNSNNNNMI